MRLVIAESGDETVMPDPVHQLLFGCQATPMPCEVGQNPTPAVLRAAVVLRVATRSGPDPPLHRLPGTPRPARPLRAAPTLPSPHSLHVSATTEHGYVPNVLVSSLERQRNIGPPTPTKRLIAGGGNPSWALPEFEVRRAAKNPLSGERMHTSVPRVPVDELRMFDALAWLSDADSMSRRTVHSGEGPASASGPVRGLRASVRFGDGRV
jgi:hypothetical protein